MTTSRSDPAPHSRDPFTLSTLRWTVPMADRGSPLAAYLARELRMAEEETADLIDFGSVQIQGLGERNSGRRLSGGEEVCVFFPHGGVRRHYEIDPKRILYQDAHLLAYDKEAGVPSQQTPADGYNNLYAAILRFLDGKRRKEAYAALHHRLDRETSGVMVFVLDRSANRRMGKAFESRQVVKDYLAWVQGVPKEESWVSRHDIGRVSGRYCALPPGKGKGAETAFRKLAEAGGRSLVHARPHTGRTHQIRLHCAAEGLPIVGDRLYGGPAAPRLFLHAFRLHLPHPATGRDLGLEAPLPAEWPPPHVLDLPEDQAPAV